MVKGNEDTRQIARARRLSYFTVFYNLGEGAVSIAAGAAAGSSALLGFGFDSLIESLSGSVMIWRFKERSGATAEDHATMEKRAVKLVGYTFFILAAFVAYEAATSLVSGEPPERSALGIAIAVVSLIVMPALYYLKRTTGRQLGSQSLVADAKQTLACMMLSVALLIGLGANYLFGLWQADPAAALLITGFLVKEGYEAVRKGEVCSC